jgi:tetratricopeptide (TPR) repeat protein
MLWKRLILILTLWTLPAFADPMESPEGLLAAGRVDDAITSLSGKIRSTPNDAASYHLLCRAYFAVGDWDHAISSCEKAVSLSPDQSDYHMWLGRSYGEKADASNFLTAAALSKKVRAEFERAVALNPQNAAARTDLAEFYMEAPGIVGGGQDKARAQVAELMKVDPAKAHWVNGRLAEKAKDPATAEKEYRAAIDASDGSATAWADLASFYRKAGRFDEMEAALHHASLNHYDQSDVLVDAASTLLRANRGLLFAASLLQRYLSPATLERVSAFKAHYLLGNILEKQGDKEGAAREYRASLGLARDFGRAREALNRVGG